MSTSASTLAARDPSLVYLPISPAALDVCTAICYHSFNNFNRSVSQPVETSSLEVSRSLIVTRISRPTTFHLMAVRQTTDSGVEYWVDGVGEVLGLVLMDCADEVAALAPLVVSTSAQGRGVGRALVERCMEEARQRRITSIRLIAIVANIASFSLYHSLGFRTYQYLVALAGHVTAEQYKQLSDEMQAAGVSVRAMQRDDLAACNQLHIATTSFSRLAGLTHSFDSQPAQRQLAVAASDAQQNGAAAGATTGCYVAVRDGGRIAGYCTGWVKSSHQSAQHRQAHTCTRPTTRSLCRSLSLLPGWCGAAWPRATAWSSCCTPRCRSTCSRRSRQSRWCCT